MNCWVILGQMQKGEGKVRINTTEIDGIQHEPDSVTKKPMLMMCPPDYYGIEYEINPWMDCQHPANNILVPAGDDPAAGQRPNIRHRRVGGSLDEVGHCSGFGMRHGISSAEHHR